MAFSVANQQRGVSVRGESVFRKKAEMGTWASAITRHGLALLSLQWSLKVNFVFIAVGRLLVFLSHSPEEAKVNYKSLEMNNTLNEVI